MYIFYTGIYSADAFFCKHNPHKSSMAAYTLLNISTVYLYASCVIWSWHSFLCVLPQGLPAEKISCIYNRNHRRERKRKNKTAKRKQESKRKKEEESSEKMGGEQLTSAEPKWESAKDREMWNCEEVGGNACY